MKLHLPPFRSYVRVKRYIIWLVQLLQEVPWIDPFF